MEGKLCSIPYKKYSTVAEAKSACTSDARCKAVYAIFCDSIGTSVKLCPTVTAYYDNSNSCVYEKGKIW